MRNFIFLYAAISLVSKTVRKIVSAAFRMISG